MRLISLLTASGVNGPPLSVAKTKPTWELPAKLAQCPDLIASQRVNAWLAALDPADMKVSRPAKLDLRPLQVANLWRPQAVPEGNQDQGSVAVAVATLPRLFDQSLDFGRSQILAGPKIGIGGAAGTDRFTLFGATSRRGAFIGVFLDIEN